MGSSSVRAALRLTSAGPAAVDPRNWAVAALLAETLDELDPQYPPATVDITTEKARILATAAN